MRTGLALIALAAPLVPLEASACSIIASTGGGLSEVPGSDGHQLSSGVGLALSGSVSILSIGAGTVRVDPPSIVNPPASFDPSAIAEVAYQGSGLGGGISQSFTSAQTQFSVPNTPLDAIVVVIDNRITSPSGFPGGTYTTTTVVTCMS
jgi:hypothetical protein